MTTDIAAAFLDADMIPNRQLYLDLDSVTSIIIEVDESRGRLVRSTTGGSTYVCHILAECKSKMTKRIDQNLLTHNKLVQLNNKLYINILSNDEWIYSRHEIYQLKIQCFTQLCELMFHLVAMENVLKNEDSEKYHFSVGYE